MTRDIINGSQLNAFMNKPISIIGSITQISPDLIWFEMKTTDNQIVRVFLSERMDRPIDGYVEVHGVSTGKGVQADEYISFTNEKFDAKGYNTLCQLLYSVPNLWETS